MKLILKDFTYKGVDVKEFECVWDENKFEDVANVTIGECFKECLSVIEPQEEGS